jgi:hypothetical protein
MLRRQAPEAVPLVGAAESTHLPTRQSQHPGSLTLRQPPLDQVRRFLTAGYSPEPVSRAGAGVWSTAFRFEHGGQPLVVGFGR